MSAFLMFSQENRHRLREEFPDRKNVEISKILGEQVLASILHVRAMGFDFFKQIPSLTCILIFFWEQWRAMTDEDKFPYVQRAHVAAEQYKLEVQHYHHAK